MRKLIVALLILSNCATLFGAITSRVDTIHTPRPQEIRFDATAEQEKGKVGSRAKRDTSLPRYDFSNITPLHGDNNGNALVHYSGENSSTIFIVTQFYSAGVVTQANMWRTTNYGRNYTNETYKFPADAIVNFFYISLNASKLMFADQKNNRLYLTVDRGETFQAKSLNFDPSSLEFHPSLENSVLAFDEEHQELFTSDDFGESWVMIDRKVYRYTWDTAYTDTAVVFYEAEDTSGNTYLFKSEKNSDGTQIRTLFDSNLGPIEQKSLVLTNEYIFVEVQLNSSDTDGAGGLFVSYQRAPFSEAEFPLKSEEQHYLVVDASEGQALVAVYHYDNLTNLYLSAQRGQKYSLSLQNLKGSGLSSWQDHDASVELVRVEGVRGTFIANRLDPESNSLYYYWASFTQISYDKGATWRYILRPAYRADGTANDNCTLSECYLNLRISQPSRQGVYTKANALGLIAAHGNAGKYLNANWWGRWFSNVYLSRDGGFSWTEEFNSGAYEYAFLDHGGVVVTVSKYVGYSVYTQSIRYSCTEGLSWEDKDISTQRLYAIGMLTEPGSTTLEATIFAKTPGTFVQWLIIQLNFSVLLNTTCSPDDYIDWVPSDARQGGLCLLGEKTTYERRKPEVCCYNGRGYQRLVNTSVCPCHFQDFDCDFGYEKLSTGAPCTLSDNVPPEGAPLDCPEGSNYTATLGYRLIPGDRCEGGDYHAYAPRVYQCPVRAPTSLVLTPHQVFYRVGEPVAIALSQGFGSRISTQYRWSYGDGHSQLLTGYDSSRTVSHSYSQPGLFTVSLSASNAAGINNVSVQISVIEPVLSFSVQGVVSMTTVGSSASYSISAFSELSPTDTSQPLPSDTYNATWRLSLDSETVLTFTGAQFSYVFNTEGTHSITVEVENPVSAQLTHSFSVVVVGIPATLSLSVLSADNQLIAGQNISFWFQQGSEQDYTRYSVSYGDTSQVAGLTYPQVEQTSHLYAIPGQYSVNVTALNIAGSASIAATFTLLDEISSVSISPPHILIVGLNEVFQGDYVLKYDTTFSGTVNYVWSFNGDTSASSLAPVFTKLFHTPETVSVSLTVSNRVSSEHVAIQVQIHPASDNIRLQQDGMSYAVSTLVTLTLNSTDGVQLPIEGVLYQWDLGEGVLRNTSLPSITFRYPTAGAKVVKVFSVSDSDGSVINHVVSGTVHILSSLQGVTASYVSGTTAESTMVNFTLTDSTGELFNGPVSVRLSDDTNNQWTYSGQMFEVTDGFLPLLLSPLTKYTVYKIGVTLYNAVSSLERQLEVSRVKEVDQTVVVTLGWVSIPEGFSVSEWQEKLEDAVSQQIIDTFKVEEWRLSVDVSVVENQQYFVYVKLLPNNMTGAGIDELMTSLHDISDFYNSQESLSVLGNEPIPITSAQINDGSVSTIREYTVLGVAIGVPVLLLLSLLVILPLIVCSAIYARKYRRVSHAYSRLRQSRASNFTFTQEGLDEDDDEAPVLLQTDSKMKFSLEENFEQGGYRNPSSEKASDL